MRENYQAGNYGFGHAKQALFELILSKFDKERKAFDFYMSNHDELEAKLKQGEDKARRIAQKVLHRVREKLGFS
jgi:tryptophanyl-tRNA synthetase